MGAKWLGACLLIGCLSAMSGGINAAGSDSAEDDPCQSEGARRRLTAIGVVDADGYARDGFWVQCKVLPHDEASTILAVLQPSARPELYDTASMSGELDLHLLKIDDEGEVLAQGRFPEVASTGAVYLSGVQIDTARYQLTATDRAFGIRTFNRSQCSACDGDLSEQELSLFVERGETFLWVLRRLPTSRTSTQRVNEESGCDHAGEQLEIVIGMGEQKAGRFADLLLSRTESEIAGENAKIGKPCPATRPDKKVRTRWIFDGQQYRAPVGAK